MACNACFLNHADLVKRGSFYECYTSIMNRTCELQGEKKVILAYPSTLIFICLSLPSTESHT